MPKQYINYPQPTQSEGLDGRVGETLPAEPQVGLHWDSHGAVQLSFDIDWDVLQEIVRVRQENPDGWHGTENEGRAIFYTGDLSRRSLQELVKQTRRARDAVYGADE